ncbi:type II toxin-antitoxin system VapC family toxin [Candidatus Woesearchaeota archaeon]|nr:type II toxin-antitoxin system VapC family toxin [Candidatus Woesearchaeota archaeon]
MSVFIDASVFCSFVNESDVHHLKAKKMLQDIFSEKQEIIYSSDYIFDEVLGVCLRKAGKRIASETGSYILHSQISLIFTDRHIFQEAWQLFQTTDSLSFTDCTSLAFMKVYGIKKIITFDKGFLQRKDIEVIGC